MTHVSEDVSKGVSEGVSEDVETLYEHAPCGLLSTLPDGTVVRVNETFLGWTGYARDELIGTRRFADLLTTGGRIYVDTHLNPMLALQDQVREIALEVVCADTSRLPVLINAVMIHDDDGHPRTVRMSVVGATERREYERELLRARERAEQSEGRARALAETLQASLIPPELPTVPGVDVGAAFRPAGSGDEVGGDFYDVFETGEDDWAIVIGDVCGKGTEAATVTALARYTLRAAAMRARAPHTVLRQLNEALLRSDSDRFCTVLYLRLRGDEQGAISVTIASGGHPLPLLVDGGGAMPVGVPGTILGVLDRPPLPETTITLQPGQTLLGYTDGLVEGRQGADFFGDDQLRQVAGDHHRLDPAALVAAVLDEVVAFQHGVASDDIAMVAVRPAS